MRNTLLGSKEAVNSSLGSYISKLYQTSALIIYRSTKYTQISVVIAHKQQQI